MICYILLAIIIAVSFFAFIKCLAMAIASYCIRKDNKNNDE